MRDEQLKIIERVKKMLAMAAGKANANEAAVAANMAEKLMRKYQIDHADLVLADIKDEEVSKESFNPGDIRFGVKTKTVPTWIGVIAVGCARLNECEVNTGSGSINFFGVAGDASVALELLKYLIIEVEQLTAQYVAGRAEKNSFRSGCAVILQRRMKDMAAERVKEFQQTSAGTALVIAKQAIIKAETGINFKYPGSKRRVDAGAYSDGMAAGSKIVLRKMVK